MRKLKALEIEVPEEEYIFSGHMACAGCAHTLILRVVFKLLGDRVVVVTSPSCTSGTAQNFMVASVHSPYAATAAWASGVRAGLDMQGNTHSLVLALAGDGGTFDIGIQALSAAAERNEDFIFLCLDNEGYMMTGAQRSSATPSGAWTMTTPVLQPKWEPKKNMVAIMAEHRIPYAATATIGYPKDLIYKVNKAKALKGTRFIHALSPCPTGWRYAPNLTVRMSRLAVESKMFPLYEVENGIRYMVQRPQHEVAVHEYLMLQGRFSHLGDDAIDTIQKNVDREWKYLLHREERALTKSNDGEDREQRL